MSNYVFSPSKAGFYALSIKSSYEAAGTWPDDGVEVDDDIFSEFIGNPPAGKIRGSIDGMPAWIDAPELTAEEKVSAAESKKASLRASADAAITPLQYAADLDDATEEESALLKKWMQYVVALNRLDLSTAPDISWPEVPTT
ncbi:tail fiber assembly protein [Erwinia sp. V71]|uniref:tail fiber assembly protein n=1 Tax=Erwinia sp. V71 TaxID=3369424 RepID=UPI003F64462B